MALTILLGIPTGSWPPSARIDEATGSSRRSTAWPWRCPSFWLGILAILLFSLVLGWLPPGSAEAISRATRALEMKFLLLPARETGAAGQRGAVAPGQSEHARSAGGDDYVRTARAKGVGLGGRWCGATPCATRWCPWSTILGLQFGRLLGGAVIIESVFSWPGLGRLIRDSIGNRDYAVVQACLLMLVLLFIVINLVTDITYGILDPRIRLSGGSSR